ncbi:MAG: ABC transporter permease [Opitutaceae bacterium]|nr:ABC transporter permease [Opitutaceae bacterium]
MSPNFRIAVRFLLAKKRSMVMSLFGIVFGVAFFVVTQAQTTGFQELFIKTILGANGAIIIEDKFQNTLRSMPVEGTSFSVGDLTQRRLIAGVENPEALRTALREQFPNVVALSAIVRGSVFVTGPMRSYTGQVYGIDLDDHLRVSNLEGQIVAGDLARFRGETSGIIMGREFARILEIGIGDSVTIEASGQSGRYKVVALFETGAKDVDKSRIFMKLGDARSLLRRPFGASILQIMVHDRDRAQADAARMQQVIDHVAVAWQDREKVWLGVFMALRISSAITVSSIILISGLGMFNTLAMIVLEKTREISILRSMGYTRRDISRIFIWQGVMVLAGGTLLGSIAGALLTLGVAQVPLPIRGIFKTDTFPVNWSGWHYLAAAGTAAVIVMVASLIPARRAARLEPGDVIRGTAS